MKYALPILISLLAQPAIAYDKCQNAKTVSENYMKMFETIVLAAQKCAIANTKSCPPITALVGDFGLQNTSELLWLVSNLEADYCED